MYLEVNFAVDASKIDAAKRYRDLLEYTHSISFINSSRNLYYEINKGISEVESYINSTFEDALCLFRDKLHEVFNDDFTSIRCMGDKAAFLEYDFYKYFLKPELWVNLKNPETREMVVEACKKLKDNCECKGEECLSFLSKKGFVSFESLTREGDEYIMSVSLNLCNFVLSEDISENIMKSRTGNLQTLDIGYGKQLDKTGNNMVLNFSEDVFDWDSGNLLDFNMFEPLAEFIRIFGISHEHIVTSEKLIKSINVINENNDVVLELKEGKDYEYYINEAQDAIRLNIGLTGFKTMADLDIRLIITKSGVEYDIDEAVEVSDDNRQRVADLLRFNEVFKAKQSEEHSVNYVSEILFRELVHCEGRHRTVTNDYYDACLEFDIPDKIFETEAERLEFIKKFHVEGLSGKEDYVYNLLLKNTSSNEKRVNNKILDMVCFALSENIEEIRLHGNILKIKGKTKGVIKENIDHYFETLRAAV